MDNAERPTAWETVCIPRNWGGSTTDDPDTYVHCGVSPRFSPRYRILAQYCSLMEEVATDTISLNLRGFFYRCSLVFAPVTLLRLPTRYMISGLRRDSLGSLQQKRAWRKDRHSHCAECLESARWLQCSIVHIKPPPTRSTTSRSVGPDSSHPTAQAIDRPSSDSRTAA